MTRQPRRPAKWLGVFGVPIAIGVLSMAGLLSALLYDGIGRIFSWIAVSSPVVVSVWILFGNRRASRRPARMKMSSAESRGRDHEELR
jgi:hypothetical protein